MVPGEKEAELKARFEELCRRTEERFPGGKAYVDHYLVTTGPAAETDENDPLVKTAFAAAEAATGEKQTPFGLTCNTDMESAALVTCRDLMEAVQKAVNAAKGAE